MSTVLVDANGDWDLTGGRVTLATGAQETKQRVEGRLELFKGEWFRDQRVGMPYYQIVLVKNPDLDAIRTLILGVVAGTQGVKSVDEVSLVWDRARRKLAYTWRATHDSGAVIKGGEGAPFIPKPAGQ